MVTAIDANIFLDLLTGSLAEVKSAHAALAAAKKSGPLVASTICYAEISRNFASMDQTDEFFELMSCRVDRIEQNSAFLAGQFFDQYKRRGGTRARILPDFLIAAHAQLNADRILSRDTRFFGPNFPRLKAVSPADLI
jgi:predicted nucleic acid-binding protein